MHITLNDSVAEAFRLTKIQKIALAKMSIKTIKDLLYYFPTRYGDTAKIMRIETLNKGDTAVIYGRMTKLELKKGWKSHIPMAEADIEDDTGKIHCVWFNQPYIAKMHTEGELIRVEGKLSERRKTGALYMSNPKIEKLSHIPLAVGESLFGSEGENHSLSPVYPESRGITSLWLYHAIQKLFRNGLLDELTEIIPQEILDKYHLPGIKTAMIWIHSPHEKDHALSARKRFSFEEIFLIQLGKQKSRQLYETNPCALIDSSDNHVHEFIKRFPFTATTAQLHAIDTMRQDMKSGRPMSRLLEGDVGSGKTAIAATCAYAVINSKPKLKDSAGKIIDSKSGINQVAYMCPTEILATQHFESFIQYFSYLGIQIALITSSGCRKFPSKVNPRGWTDISRNQLLKWVANGEIHIVIGTHSLIQKSVIFKNMALAIIDEQHRFGTTQRMKLVRKHMAPHLLSMTATPIPRTLALTIYGDLDISLLDQSPAGRKQIITQIVLTQNRDATYEKIRLEIQAGRQVYIICPRIEEPDPDRENALNLRSVKAEAKRLKAKVFSEYEIGIMHGKMKPKDKDKVMNDFRAGKIHILCSTSVVEVGVNVPNATVIIIEGGERFGLSQLHQLRGRVMRSTHQSYCYVFTESLGQKSIERLQALEQAKNGFDLAEQDLIQRGPGELSGKRQWGLSDVAMEALKNLKMVECAREEAKVMISNNTLSNFPNLESAVNEKNVEVHWE
jgi:ATP-dependent DNA helicase RecG